jgi:UDP-glucose 4-epimerase
MTILVAGGSIGSHTVRALHKANENVVVIDILSTGLSAHLPESVPLFIGDAGDKNLVEGVIAQANSIMRCAGSGHGAGTDARPAALLPQHLDHAQAAQ